MSIFWWQRLPRLSVVGNEAWSCIRLFCFPPLLIKTGKFDPQDYGYNLGVIRLSKGVRVLKRPVSTHQS